MACGLASRAQAACSGFEPCVAQEVGDRRLVRVARTCGTEAPGRTCQHSGARVLDREAQVQQAVRPDEQHDVPRQAQRRPEARRRHGLARVA